MEINPRTSGTYCKAGGGLLSIPNALNPFALQQEDLLVWPVDKIIYGEWGRVKHEVRSPPQEVCKKGIHPSGCMASVSLPVCYELKDVSGIFQPISFHSPEIEKTFG